MLVKRKQYLDLFKFVFSFCVIGIHCQIFYNSNPLLYNFVTMGLFRIIPPFFFTISGYFFYTIVDNKNKIKVYLKKYLKLYLLFEIIEVIVYLLFGCNIFDFFLKIITVGIGGVYWYIISLLLALIISLPFYKNKNLTVIFIIGLLLYFLSATNDTYGYMFLNTSIQRLSIFKTQIWTWAQGGISMSLLFVTIGAALNKYKIKVNNFIYVILSLFIYMVEVYFCQTLWAFDGNCYITLIIITPILASYLLNKDNILSFNTKILGELSIYIYFLHPIIIYVLKSVIFISNDMLFILTSILTIIVAYVLFKMKNVSAVKKIF